MSTPADRFGVPYFPNGGTTATFTTSTLGPAVYKPPSVTLNSAYWLPAAKVRRRSQWPLRIAIGHAAFFMLLALAGWLR